jgi:hypothetical protein
MRSRERPLENRLHDVETWRKKRLARLHVRRASTAAIMRAAELYTEVAAKGDLIALSRCATFRESE